LLSATIEQTVGDETDAMTEISETAGDGKPDRQHATALAPVASSHVSMTDTVRAGVRSYLSVSMLRSAISLRDHAAVIEAEHPEDWASPHVEDHQDLIVSSVTNAALFLEAMINELFVDAHDGEGRSKDGYLAPLDDRTVSLMASWWKESGGGFDRVLSKYQLLLAFADQPPLDQGAEPYQSTSDLIALRNAIVHYKPSTVYSDVEHALERRLKKHHFAANGRLPKGSGPWWPHGALGVGCATWAISSSEALTDEVARRLGLVPAYRRVLRGARP
jgi:hypothetical protein